MTRPTPPVVLPDGSAFLPDGTHVPAEAIAHAVEAITWACKLLDSLIPEARDQLRGGEG